jgi:NADH-quinone oxidoreductase subunit N
MDPVAWWFKLIFLLAGLITVVLSMDLLDGRPSRASPSGASPSGASGSNDGSNDARLRVRGIGFRGEYYTLLLFTIAGMMYLISARDLITLYVALELATIPLYALAAWQRESARSGEAGMKYVIIGALASAFILYGLGILYGLTGTTDLEAIGRAVKSTPAFWLAAAMVLTGAGFKLTLVPFHFWAADVYQGAPMPVTAYLSVASKGAGLAFIFQLFFRLMGPHLSEWALPIAILAALTMTVGNVVAIVQQNIKRFMAFSAISQAGYLIMGFLGPFSEGVSAMIFYMLVYTVSNLAVFACIVWYSNETGREQVQDYRGLSRTNPLLALAMMVALFSLAGIPPLSGFVGKFFLFSVASKAGFHWLVAVAAVNSTISLYYYLRIVRQMYIEPVFEGATQLPISRPLAVATAVLAAGVVLLGIIPFFYETVSAQTVGWLATLLQ